MSHAHGERLDTAARGSPTGSRFSPLAAVVEVPEGAQGADAASDLELEMEEDMVGEERPSPTVVCLKLLRPVVVSRCRASACAVADLYRAELCSAIVPRWTKRG
jgi:hypothetical protein